MAVSITATHAPAEAFNITLEKTVLSNGVVMQTWLVNGIVAEVQENFNKFPCYISSSSGGCVVVINDKLFQRLPSDTSASIMTTLGAEQTGRHSSKELGYTINIANKTTYAEALQNIWLIGSAGLYFIVFLVDGIVKVMPWAVNAIELQNNLQEWHLYINNPTDKYSISCISYIFDKSCNIAETPLFTDGELLKTQATSYALFGLGTGDLYAMLPNERGISFESSSYDVAGGDIQLPNSTTGMLQTIASTMESVFVDFVENKPEYANKLPRVNQPIKDETGAELKIAVTPAKITWSNITDYIGNKSVVFRDEDSSKEYVVNTTMNLLRDVYNNNVGQYVQNKAYFSYLFAVLCAANTTRTTSISTFTYKYLYKLLRRFDDIAESNTTVYSLFGQNYLMLDALTYQKVYGLQLSNMSVHNADILLRGEYSKLAYGVLARTFGTAIGQEVAETFRFRTKRFAKCDLKPGAWSPYGTSALLSDSAVIGLAHFGALTGEDAATNEKWALTDAITEGVFTLKDMRALYYAWFAYIYTKDTSCGGAPRDEIIAPLVSYARGLIVPHLLLDEEVFAYIVKIAYEDSSYTDALLTPNKEELYYHNAIVQDAVAYGRFCDDLESYISDSVLRNASFVRTKMSLLLESDNYGVNAMPHIKYLKKYDFSDCYSPARYKFADPRVMVDKTWATSCVHGWNNYYKQTGTAVPGLKINKLGQIATTPNILVNASSNLETVTLVHKVFDAYNINKSIPTSKGSKHLPERLNTYYLEQKVSHIPSHKLNSAGYMRRVATKLMAPYVSRYWTAMQGKQGSSTAAFIEHTLANNLVKYGFAPWAMKQCSAVSSNKYATVMLKDDLYIDGKAELLGNDTIIAYIASLLQRSFYGSIKKEGTPMHAFSPSAIKASTPVTQMAVLGASSLQMERITNYTMAPLYANEFRAGTGAHVVTHDSTKMSVSAEASYYRNHEEMDFCDACNEAYGDFNGQVYRDTDNDAVVINNAAVFFENADFVQYLTALNSVIPEGSEKIDIDNYYTSQRTLNVKAAKAQIDKILALRDSIYVQSNKELYAYLYTDNSSCKIVYDDYINGTYTRDKYPFQLSDTMHSVIARPAMGFINDSISIREDIITDKITMQDVTSRATRCNIIGLEFESPLHVHEALYKHSVTVTDGSSVKEVPRLVKTPYDTCVAEEIYDVLPLPLAIADTRKTFSDIAVDARTSSEYADVATSELLLAEALPYGEQLTQTNMLSADLRERISFLAAMTDGKDVIYQKYATAYKLLMQFFKDVFEDEILTRDVRTDLYVAIAYLQLNMSEYSLDALIQVLSSNNYASVLQRMSVAIPAYKDYYAKYLDRIKAREDAATAASADMNRLVDEIAAFAGDSLATTEADELSILLDAMAAEAAGIVDNAVDGMHTLLPRAFVVDATNDAEQKVNERKAREAAAAAEEEAKQNALAESEDTDMSAAMNALANNEAVTDADAVLETNSDFEFDDEEPHIEETSADFEFDDVEDSANALDGSDDFFTSDAAEDTSDNEDDFFTGAVEEEDSVDEDDFFTGNAAGLEGFGAEEDNAFDYDETADADSFADVTDESAEDFFSGDAGEVEVPNSEDKPLFDFEAEDNESGLKHDSEEGDIEEPVEPADADLATDELRDTDTEIIDDSESTDEETEAIRPANPVVQTAAFTPIFDSTAEIGALSINTGVKSSKKVNRTVAKALGMEAVMEAGDMGVLKTPPQPKQAVDNVDTVAENVEVPQEGTIENKVDPSVFDEVAPSITEADIEAEINSILPDSLKGDSAAVQTIVPYKELIYSPMKPATLEQVLRKCYPNTTIAGIVLLDSDDALTEAVLIGNTTEELYNYCVNNNATWYFDEEDVLRVDVRGKSLFARNITAPRRMTMLKRVANDLDEMRRILPPRKVVWSNVVIT